MIVDKQCIQQVLGGLLKKPQYLSQIDKYNLSISDFSTRFERYIFTAIQGLYYNGAKNINPIDIENYLSEDEVAKRTFIVQNGIDYLQDIEELCDEENFDYYYKKLKKFNLLRDLEKQGINISSFYNENLLDPSAAEINKNFEKLTISDIIETLKKKLLKLENNYSQSEAVQVEHMSDNIDDFFDELKENIDIGLPVQGEIYNKVIGGAKKGCLTIRSGSSGLGKAISNKDIVPTPSGWRLVGNINVGDYLYDGFGKPTKVLGVFPQGKKRMYKIIFEDNRELLCSGDHIWSVIKEGEENKIFDRNFTDYTSMELYLKKENFYIPMQQPLLYKENLFVDNPYEIGYKSSLLNKVNINCYIKNSVSIRCLFLAGIFDHCAHINSKNQTINFIIKNSVNAIQIEELLNTLGIKIINKFKKFDDTIFIIKGKKELLLNCFKHNILAKFLIKRYFKNTPDIFLNLIKSIQITDSYEDCTCFFVDNKEHLFLAGDMIVTHNTRQAIGDAAFLSYPIRWNNEKNCWEQNGNNEKVLFIVTEQSFKEVKKMILSYLTGINESRFKICNFNKQEEKRIQQAISLIKKYENNLIFLKIPDPNIELIKAAIRENCLIYNIDYVFYDYVFISPALLKEYKNFGLRNDELLLLMATALKDLAVELDVCIMTSTQVNAKTDDSKDIRNESTLAGGRATINKADNGAIMARPTKEELEVLKPITEKYGIPNLVTDIFKVRSGEWTQVRIWSNVDLGRLRKKDLFITRANFEIIDNFFDEENYRIYNWTDKEYKDFNAIIEDFNNGLRKLN